MDTAPAILATLLASTAVTLEDVWFKLASNCIVFAALRFTFASRLTVLPLLVLTFNETAAILAEVWFKLAVSKFILVVRLKALALVAKCLASIDSIPYSLVTSDPLAIFSADTAFASKTVDVTRVSAILAP